MWLEKKIIYLFGVKERKEKERTIWDLKREREAHLEWPTWGSY